MGEKVLITGGAGYIGSKLVNELRGLMNLGYGELVRAFDITVIDNLLYNQGPTVFTALNGVSFINETITPELSPKVISAIEEADVIIPLAAIVGAPAVDKYPKASTDINYNVIKSIVDIMRDDQFIIYPNTNSGYGKAGDNVCTEETPLTPISLYGKLKDEAEYVVRTHPKHIVFRLATVFGVSFRHRLDLLVNTLVWEAVRYGKIQIFDDSYMRNYIHIEDICRAFLFAIQHRDRMAGNVYNLGNDELNMSKGDLTEVIKTVIPCTVEKINKTDPDQRDYIVSSDKLYKTGWKPAYDLEYGVEELRAFYKFVNDANLQQMTNVV